MPYSPGSLPTSAKAARAAREFADLVASVINTTISACPISFVELERPSFEGFVGYCQRKVPAPLQLSNGRYLYLYQRLGLRRDQQFLATLDYTYTYQGSDDPESWIWRYEYVREPGEEYTYPLCHLHVNAEPDAYYGEKPFPRLHLPTGRVTIEAVVRHLVNEQGVEPISDRWQEVLTSAEDAFREIQKRRLLD